MNNNKTMGDKELVEDVLLTEKLICALYHYATTEASTQSLRAVYKETLNEELDMQNNVYQTMSQKGWYPSEQAEQKQIDKVKTKYQAQ